MTHPSNHAMYCPVFKAIDATPDMCGCGADEVDEFAPTDPEEMEPTEANRGRLVSEAHELAILRQIEEDDPEVTVWSLHPAKGVGPVHEAPNPKHYGLSWCGKRAQFRHWVRPGHRSDVTCKPCLRQIELGQPKAWKS